MLKRNWKIIFVIFSQTVNLLSIWLTGAVLFTLKWNGIVQYVTPDDHLQIGFIIFAVIYVTIASMMGLSKLINGLMNKFRIHKRTTFII